VEFDIKAMGNYNNNFSKLQGCEKETWCEKLGDASNTLLARIVTSFAHSITLNNNWLLLISNFISYAQILLGTSKCMLISPTRN